MINSDNFIYLIPYFISLGISLGVAFYTFRHRSVAGATSYAIVALLQATIILGYIFELVSPTLESKIFWDSFQWFGTVFMPVAFFAFALEYTGQIQTRSKQVWGLLLIIPTIFMLLVITSEWHQLTLAEPTLIHGDPFSALVYDFTTAVWLIAIYIYGLIFSSAFLLIRQQFHSHSIYKIQTSTIIIGMLFPVIGSILTLAGLTLTFQRDIVPITLAIGNLVVVWGLYRFRLFDLVPVARDTLIEKMPDIVIVLDAKNRIVDLNSIATDFIGEDKTQIIGQTSEIVFSKWARLAEAVKEIKNIQTEIILSRKGSQRVYDLRITSLNDRKGRFLGRVVSMRDISKLKQAEKIQAVLLNITQTAVSTTSLEKLLAYVHEQLGKLIDTTNFYVALYDKTTNQYSFPFWADEFDQEEEDWDPQPLPKSYTDYVRRTGQPMLADWEIHHQLVELGHIELIDAPSDLWLGAPLRTPDGIIGVIVVQSYYNPDLYTVKDLDLLTFASDTIALVIERKTREETLDKYRNHLEELVEKRTTELAQANQILRREILERKHTEEKLQAYTKKLERQNRELQDFAHISSHDLQEPLRKIQTFSDRLQSKYEGLLDEQGQDYLARMRNAALHSQAMIEDLYVYSRVSYQENLLKKVDLEKLLEALLADFNIQIKQKKAEIIIGPLPIIEADSTQIRQLFKNLISNALKFHRKGIPPVIEINEVQSEAVAAGCCCISVADNGIGFEEKYLDRIFTVFQRLHSNEEYEGTGIGLAICRRIVEGHNGRIRATSTPNKGATFFIELPKRQA